MSVIGWGLVFQRVRSFYHFKFSPREPNFYRFNPSKSPQLLPESSPSFQIFARALRARLTQASEGSGDRSGSFSIAVAAQASGGPQLHTTFLTEDMFAAAAMRALATDLMAMEVTVYTELAQTSVQSFS